MVPFVLPFKKMRTLFTNLQFIKFNYLLFMQIMFWINSLGIIAITIWVPNRLCGWISLVNCILSIITRSSNIAAKYATFSPQLIKKYREKVLSLKEVTGEFILNNWARQDPDLMEEETINALRRNGFDDGIFSMSFLDNLNDKLEQDIDYLETELFLTPPPRSIVKSKNNLKERTYYSGQVIFFIACRKYNKERNRRPLFIFTCFLSIVWGFVPLIARLLVGLKLYNPDNVFDTIIFYYNIIICTLLFFLTNLFYSQATIDVGRTVYLMRQLSHLISTQKKSNEIKKLLPTINFLEEFSLNSWKILRRVCIDYGKRYFFRHEMYLPVVFLLATICFLSIFLVPIAQSKAPELFDPNLNMKEIQYALGIFSILLFTMTFTLLMGFASINEFFEFHVLKLYNVKQVLSDLLKYHEYYFRDALAEIENGKGSEEALGSADELEPQDEDAYFRKGKPKQSTVKASQKDFYTDIPNNSSRKMLDKQGIKATNEPNEDELVLDPTDKDCHAIDLNNVFRTRSLSHVHVRLAREIKLTLGPSLKTELRTFLRKSMDSVQNIIQEVEIDQRYQSVEILGFVLSKPFILNLYVVIISIAVTLYQFVPS
jgi:hypothetical protein